MKKKILKHLQTLQNILKFSYKQIINHPKFSILSMGGLILLLLSKSGSPQRILHLKLSQFLNLLQKDKVLKVSLQQKYLIFIDKNKQKFTTSHILYPKSQLFNKLINKKIEFQTFQVFDHKASFFVVLVISALITFLWTYLFSDIFSSKINKTQKVKYNFQNVVGLDECKQALNQVILFMKQPQIYKDIGARMRRGIVFYGPSGTGKTSLAKACAGQANVPFYSCNAAEFRQMYVGMGAKKVRQLFKKAKQTAPSIIYIDEIDAIGNRSNGVMQNFDGAASQKNTTINQLLSEMDGFDSSQLVLVIGSTNKLQLIDQSLLRAGRFDLKIKVPLPNQKDRTQIFTHYLKNKKHNLEDLFIRQVALKVKGWSGAELENLANQCVYISLRRKSKHIEKEDVQECLKILL